MKIEDVFHTKTEEQAHADWAKRAESSEQAQAMQRKIDEYERARRPITLTAALSDENSE